MTLVKFRNRDYFPTRRMHHGVDDMFNWFLNEAPSYGECSAYPSANIIDNDDNYIIEMLVPGYSKEDIRIQFENGILSVVHSREDEAENQSGKYVSREFSPRNFNRRFRLSDKLASEKISASYKNGVLEITIPKREEAKPKPVQEISID